MERGVTDSRIEDCLLENIGVGAEYGGGIRMAWGSNRNRVERNIVKTTGRGGIFGDHSSDLIIRHNQVSGSGGEGLGLEVWGGCPRSLIEDNAVDHWLSVDRGERTAVRRNTVGTDDGSLKGYGIEIIASNVVVTDNVVKRGALIGLSVSNVPPKNNVFWGYNSVSDCLEWGAQFQGETGGIAHHYFYRCEFQRTVRGDSRATYPEASGHGFRFNGMTRHLMFEECAFRDNDGFGIQTCGEGVDALNFVRCSFNDNREGVAVGFEPHQRVDFRDCLIRDGGRSGIPPTAALTTALPTADFECPENPRVGQPIPFTCLSQPGTGMIVERLWDFQHGVAETEPRPQHTFDASGDYRVTLIVWDRGGQGARREKTIQVLPDR
jgi:parallel beta-helix repeat protein